MVMSVITVREFLTTYNEKHGYGIDDGCLIESLIEEGVVVHKGDTDQHRWYIMQECVSEIEGVYIRFTDYIITGDMGMADMDLSYDLDSAEIVTKRERQVTEVYYE